MLGLTSMKIDYSELNYDNQWNGYVFDPNINPGEKYARSSRSYLNLNAGVAYIKSWSRKKEFVLGTSLFNISNPPQSFFDEDYVKLDLRFNLHGSYRFPIKDRLLLEPMMIYMSQGTYQEFNAGGLAHYVLEEKPYMWRAIYAGVFGRAQDAGYIIAGIQYDAWNVGISYDINTSNLKPASNGRGGFELSAVYIIPRAPKAKPVKVCPDFM